MRRMLIIAAMLALAAGFSAQAAGVEGLLESLVKPKNFKAERQSSYDPSGGNADGRQDKPIQPGETREMASIEGAGAITHIWVTIASQDRHHLKNLVIRMYWDGEENPSVESPIGDFFGLGNSTYYHYQSLPIQIGTNNGLNCFWRMPFAEGARVTITNDGPIAVDAFYYYVDYQRYDSLPEDTLRFHAQYKQEYPTTPRAFYTILEAKGRGHYVGCNVSLHLQDDGWWGEGDDMIYVDGETSPSLHGTGSEDYFCGAWCYGEAFSTLYFGCPQRGEHKSGELWNVYRYHLEDPIPFTESIRVDIEHGHANDRKDDWASVAYWYQTEPHVPYPPLPSAAERQPAPPEPPYKELDAMELEGFVEQFGAPEVTVQNLATFADHWSDDRHVWFQPEEPDTFSLTLDLTEEEAETEQIKLWYTMARDYGIVEIWVNGDKAARWDGYHPDDVIRREITFPVDLEPGENTFEVRITGKNPSSTGYYAGIDCFSSIFPQDS